MGVSQLLSMCPPALGGGPGDCTAARGAGQKLGALGAGVLTDGRPGTKHCCHHLPNGFDVQTPGGGGWAGPPQVFSEVAAKDQRGRLTCPGHTAVRAELSLTAGALAPVRYPLLPGPPGPPSSSGPPPGGPARCRHSPEWQAGWPSWGRTRGSAGRKGPPGPCRGSSLAALPHPLQPRVRLPGWCAPHPDSVWALSGAALRGSHLGGVPGEEGSGDLGPILGCLAPEAKCSCAPAP